MAATNLEIHNKIQSATSFLIIVAKESGL